MRTEWRRHTMTWQQKRNLFVFLISVILLLLVYILLPRDVQTIMKTDTPEIQQIIAEIEAVRVQDSIQTLPVRHPFNPNYISNYQAYIFSIDIVTLDSIRAYRNQGKWINSIADFKKVTNWNDSQIQEIEPYLRFPEWVEESANKQNSLVASKAKITKKDLNQASKEELMEVSGIGEVLASRILEWRTRLDGFSDSLQINHVYGLNDWSKTNLWEHFYVTKREVQPRLNVNDASASDLTTIPGVNFELAREIWEFQHLREGVDSIDELIKIEGMTRAKLELIALYLYAN